MNTKCKQSSLSAAGQLYASKPLLQVVYFFWRFQWQAQALVYCVTTTLTEQETRSERLWGFRLPDFPSFRVTEFLSFWISELPSFQVSKFPSFQGREGGRTNERPGTDNVISGPMRGLEKNCTRWRTQTDKQTSGHGDSMTNSAQWGRVGENTFVIHSFSQWIILFLWSFKTSLHPNRRS